MLFFHFTVSSPVSLEAVSEDLCFTTAFKHAFRSQRLSLICFSNYGARDTANMRKARWFLLTWSAYSQRKLACREKSRHLEVFFSCVFFRLSQCHCQDESLHACVWLHCIYACKLCIKSPLGNPKRFPHLDFCANICKTLRKEEGRLHGEKKRRAREGQGRPWISNFAVAGIFSKAFLWYKGYSALTSTSSSIKHNHIRRNPVCPNFPSSVNEAE